MGTIIVFLLMTGLVAIIIGYINQSRRCPPSEVQYRFIPRTFEEEQNDPVRVSQLFRNMFEDPTPWLSGYRMGFVKPNVYDINKYYVSQS